MGGEGVGGGEGRNHSPPRSGRRAGRAPPARKRGPASRRWLAAPALWARALGAPLAAKAPRREAGGAEGGARTRYLVHPIPHGGRAVWPGARRQAQSGHAGRARRSARPRTHGGARGRPAGPTAPLLPALRPWTSRPPGRGASAPVGRGSRRPHPPPPPSELGACHAGPPDLWTRLLGGWARAKGFVSWGRWGAGTGTRLLGSEASGITAPRRPGQETGDWRSSEARARAHAHPSRSRVRVLSLGGAGGHAGAPRPGGESHGGSPGITVTKTPAGLSPGRLGACYQQSPPCLDCLGESGANQSLGLGSSPVWVF